MVHSWVRDQRPASSESGTYRHIDWSTAVPHSGTGTMSAPSYLEHLSDADLAFLAEAGREPGAELRTRPAQVAALLAEPAVFDALFRAEPDGLLVRPSPFLMFACVVERAARALRAPP